MARLIRFAIAAGIVLVTSAARANCFPAVLFSQVSFDYGYDYVHVPDPLDPSWDRIVGRFWEGGFRDGGQEGTYDDSQWLWACSGYACGGGVPGRVFYLNGNLGAAGVINCPRDADLVVVLQTPSLDQTWAGFAAGRVSYTPTEFYEYDFAHIRRDWTFAAIPRPRYTRYTRTLEGLELDLTLDDVAGGIYTVNPVDRTGVVSAYRVHAFRGLDDPGRAASSWGIPLAATPYTGSGGNLAHLVVSCAPGERDVWLATALEFDGGQFSGDYLGAALHLDCGCEQDADLDEACDAGLVETLDNCPGIPNADQADADADGEGDACECDDPDGDGVCTEEDNCPSAFNPDQHDRNHDGRGDACHKKPKSPHGRD
jgi:hypothetical protein